METPQPHQHYLSDLMKVKIVSNSGECLGRLWDLVVDLDLPEPEVVKLVYRRFWSKQHWYVNWNEVDSIERSRVTLKVDSGDSTPPTKSMSEILLRDFLLDKQIVDVDGAKVERVNDLQFLSSNGKLILAQVDVGLRGLLRRLGFESAVVRFMKWFFDYNLKERFIAWHFAQPLADPDRLRLQISQSSIASLHPADLADIMEDLDVHERAAVVDSLNDEIVAEAIEEMDPKVQVSIIQHLSPEKAADIIEEMSPDEAADLIADLPEESVSDIFREMDDEYVETVQGLMEHEVDEAGGLMTTQFLALAPNKTIVEALAHIKQLAEETDVIYYIYVVDNDSKLLGVVNLRDLLSNEIFTPLEQIMTTRLVTAEIDEEAEDLADLFAKYGFRAIPVVDNENRIIGVIRFKALLEILAPHLGK
jgi:magnesium transporter